MPPVDDGNVSENTGPLHFISAAYIDEYLWTNALEWNGYYRVNMMTGKAEFLGFFEYADMLRDKLFYQVLAWKKYVFFIPWIYDYLVRLDTVTLEIRYWRLPERIVREIAKFRSANIYEEKIVMFPHVGDDICIFHMKEEKFECENRWVRDMVGLETGIQKDCFLQGCQKGKFVYLPNLMGSFILKFNLEDYGHEIISFPDTEKKIVDITEYDNNRILALSWAGNVWKYNIDTGERELIYKYSGNIEFPYRHILVLENHFYLIPSKEKNIKIFDQKGERIISYPNGWKQKDKMAGLDFLFNGCLKSRTENMLYPCLGNMLLKIEPQQEKTAGLPICENKEPREKEMIRQIESESSNLSERILEEPKPELDLFLKVFIGRKQVEDNALLNTAGAKIWNQVRGR